MKTVIDAFRAEADMNDVKIAVGGAPVNRMFADEIEADGYGADAPSSVELFLEMVTA
jgi:5-methyltetrahydrofolate--homocysteine methyltransferase